MGHAIPTSSPASVAALDEPGPGGACHRYGIQYGGPDELLIVQFQTGPRGVEGSTPGVFLDDLLAIAEDQLAAFQRGQFASVENDAALAGIRHARTAIGKRVSARDRGLCPVRSRGAAAMTELAARVAVIEDLVASLVARLAAIESRDDTTLRSALVSVLSTLPHGRYTAREVTGFLRSAGCDIGDERKAWVAVGRELRAMGHVMQGGKRRLYALGGSRAGQG